MTTTRLQPAVALVLALLAALTTGCTEPSAPEGRELVVIKGERFFLEPALDQPTRTIGLGNRELIEDRGGMIFVFPRAQRREFVMRNCPYPIDIAYLSEEGRVMVMHEMLPEEPKSETESDLVYEYRLKRYSSRFPTRFVVEVQGGTWQRLGLAAGDLIEFDIESLKARAR